MIAEPVRRLHSDGEQRPLEEAIVAAGCGSMTNRQAAYAIHRGHLTAAGRRVRLSDFRLGRKWMTSVDSVRRYVRELNEANVELGEKVDAC